jgi:hypothetical protein
VYKRMVKYLVGFVCAIMLYGCTSDCFYDSTIGSSATIGLIIPSESIINCEVLNKLDGCRIKIKEPCYVKHSFSITNSTTWFGLITTGTIANNHIEVCSTNIIHQTQK